MEEVNRRLVEALSGAKEQEVRQVAPSAQSVAVFYLPK